ncbi:MAG: 3-oxoacyl-[acyl-carrier-protein] reductase [Simkaniaceae bacterium]
MALLNEKKALVTGGTSGIGRAIALEFAKEGASVAIFGTNEERAKKVVEELKEIRLSTDQLIVYDLVDVSDTSQVEIAAKSLEDSWGALDILVNNAGITRDKLFLSMREEDWDRVLNVNLKSVYNVTKSFVRKMLKNRSGKIINISSVIGLVGNPGQVNYAASKSGMIGMTRSLARELAAKNITVNCIAPGFIETAMTDQLTEEQKQAIINRIPMKRLGTGEDIAHTALFLASALSGYITGQVIAVDGGMLA